MRCGRGGAATSRCALTIWVSHEEIFASGNVVAAFGSAGGTINGNKWEIPAAWRAVVRDGLVQEWRIYADNKPVYDILAKPR